MQAQELSLLPGRERPPLGQARRTHTCADTEHVGAWWLWEPELEPLSEHGPCSTSCWNPHSHPSTGTSARRRGLGAQLDFSLSLPPRGSSWHSKTAASFLPTHGLSFCLRLSSVHSEGSPGRFPRETSGCPSPPLRSQVLVLVRDGQADPEQGDKPRTLPGGPEVLGEPQDPTATQTQQGSG